VLVYIKCTYTLSHFAFWQTDMNTYENVFSLSDYFRYKFLMILIMR